MKRVAAIVVLASAQAFAQSVPIAPGVTLGEPRFTTGRGTPIFVGETHLVTLLAGNDVAQCVDGADAIQRSLLTSVGWERQRVAVNRATDEIYVISSVYREPVVGGAVLDGLQIVRTDCESRLDVLYENTASTPEWLWRADNAFAEALLPMATDGTLFLPAVDGIYLWSIAAPASAPTRLVGMDAFTTVVLASQDDPFDQRRHAAPDTLSWRIVGGVALDDGSLFVNMQARGVPSGSATQYNFEVDRSGAVTLLWRVRAAPTLLDFVSGDGGADFVLGSWTYSQELGGALLAASQGRAGMGIVPTDRPEVLGTYPRPVLPLALSEVETRSERYVCGSNREPFAWTMDGALRTVRPIEFDLSQVDFDGDGLRWTDEVAAGLDDRAIDHDGDGFHDGVERVLYETRADSASSVPDVSLEVPTVGFSARLGDWLFNEEPLRSESVFGRSVICPAPERCLDGRRRPAEIRVEGGLDGTLLASASSDGRLVTLFDSFEPLRWVLVDGVRFGGGDEIVRETSTGSFAVLSPARADCPFLGVATEMAARCARAEEAIPDGARAERLGYLPSRGSVLLGLETPRGWVAASSGVEHTEVFTDGRLFQGWEPQRIIPLAADGSAAWLVEAQLQGVGDVARRWYLADANLVPRELLRLWPPSPFTPVQMPIGGEFAEGPVIRMRAGFAKPNSAFLGGPSACTAGAGGTVTCGRPQATPSPFEPDFHSLLAQLTEVEPGLQAGEVLVSGGGFRSAVLGRITENAAYVPWLTYERFNRLLETEIRIEEVRLRDLDVAPDASRVCLVEEQPAAGSTLPSRVWEVSVTSGLPSAARLVYEDFDSPAGVCGYDGDGVLHWEVDGAIVNEAGGRMETSIARPRHLQWLVDRWVIIGDLDGHESPDDPSSEAACVGVDGANDLGDVMAITELDGLVHLLDSFGRVVVVRAEQVCDGGGSRELALQPAPSTYLGQANVWSLFYEGVFEINGSTFTGAVDWRVEHAAMVARPDGALIVVPGQTWWGRGARPPIFSWWLRGSYWPEDPSNRIEELDPLRRDEDFANVLTVGEVDAPLARVPGDATWPDLGYEHFGEPPPRPRDPTISFDAGPGADAGTDDAGMMGGGGKGCGCATLEADASPLLLLLALLVARRRASPYA